MSTFIPDYGFLNGSPKGCNRCGRVLPATREYFRVDNAIKCGIAPLCLRCQVDKTASDAARDPNAGSARVRRWAVFELKHSEEQEIAFHWSNQRPLSGVENRAKRDKII
jgi:hypothetical protein